ncbi:MAG: hypothetical protein ABI597_09280 [Gammaproteobacteria bacterium]
MTPESTNTKPLFRENAINSINSAEEIQRCLKVVSTSSWIGISILLSVLIGILIWSVYGEVTMVVMANGIIIPLDQLQQTEKSLKDNLTSYKERVALLKNLLQQKKVLFINHYLTIVDFSKAQEEYLSAKEELANMAKDIDVNTTNLKSDKKTTNSGNFFALAFVNHAEGKKISPDMEAYVLPSTVTVYDYGYIKGKVSSVSEYPVSKETAYSYLGNKSLVDEFFSRGTPIMLKLELRNSEKNKNQFDWTSKTISSVVIRPGTKVDVKIIYKKSSPLQLLVGRVGQFK